MSGASARANGRASGPVLQFVFLAVINHSGGGCKGEEKDKKGRMIRVGWVAWGRPEEGWVEWERDDGKECWDGNGKMGRQRRVG